MLPEMALQTSLQGGLLQSGLSAEWLSTQEWGQGREGLARLGWGSCGLVVTTCHCGEGRKEEQGKQG